MAWASEEQLAAVVCSYLRGLHWDVYQEVEGYAGVADIVAVQGPVVWVIEAKLTLGFAVIGQAKRWLPHAHLVSVAVPRPRKITTARRTAAEVLGMLGVGCIEVAPPHMYSRQVREPIKAPLHRWAKTQPLREALEPEHKTTAAAGSATGSRWTPFKRTCRDLVAAVEAEPGISLKRAIGSIEHHYASHASARSSLRHYVTKGIVDGIELRDEGGPRLYPVAAGEGE